VNPRATGLLLLLAGALGAFVWFYEIQGEEGRKAASDAKNRLFPAAAADAVERIELTTTDGQAARLERKDGSWRIAKPLEARADAFTVDGIASALTQISSESVYANPQPPETYGLGAGAREVAFGGGGAEHRLRIGAKTPVGGNDYVSVDGRGEVFVVRSYRVSALGKRLDEIRDKRIVEVSPDGVEAIEVRWRDGHVALARESGEWTLREPVAGRADATTVQTLLSNLSFLRAIGFSEPPMPDAESGLDHPELVVDLSLAPAAGGGEPRRVSVAMGKLLVGGDRPVRGPDGTLFLVSGSRIDDVPRKVVAYRFKDLARFSADAARRVELSFGTPEGAPLAITATRSEDGDWSSLPEAMDPEKIRALVDELSQLRAHDILADSMGAEELRGVGLDPPRVKLVVRGGEGAAPPLAELRLGVVRDGGGVVAQAEGNAAVFELDPAVAEVVPTGVEAFRANFAAKPPEPPAEPPAPAAAAAAQSAEEAAAPAPGPEPE